MKVIEKIYPECFKITLAGLLNNKKLTFFCKSYDLSDNEIIVYDDFQQILNKYSTSIWNLENSEHLNEKHCVYATFDDDKEQNHRFTVTELNLINQTVL